MPVVVARALDVLAPVVVAPALDVHGTVVEALALDVRATVVGAFALDVLATVVDASLCSSGHRPALRAHQLDALWGEEQVACIASGSVVFTHVWPLWGEEQVACMEPWLQLAAMHVFLYGGMLSEA